MMPFGFIVEASVAVLLAVTLGYCVILNHRLKRLHNDRDMLRQIAADLVRATGLANTAIKELKTTAVEADLLLNSRLEEADRFGVELANHIHAGHALMERIAKITSVARHSQMVDPAHESEPTRMQSALAQLAARSRPKGNAA